MNYTEEYFNIFKDRYVKSLIFKYEQLVSQGRDKEFTSRHFISTTQFMLAFNTDETTKNIVSYFDIMYRLGHKVESIIENIETDLWVQRKRAVEGKDNWEENLKTVTKYRKLLWVFNIKFLPREIIDYNKDGSVYRHRIFRYKYSLEKIKKLQAAKTDDERALIYNNEILQIEHVVIPTQSIKGWIHFDDPSIKRVFKIVVKYKAQEEFSANLRKKGVFNESSNKTSKDQDADTKKAKEKIRKQANGSQQEYTKKRQVAALFFLLKHVGFDWGNTDNTKLAKLLHLLSGVEVLKDENGKEKISNSYIYKMTRGLLSGENKPLRADLIFVKKIFENLNIEDSETLKNLLTDMEREIKNSKD